MKCPHCTKEIHFQYNEAHAYLYDEEESSPSEENQETEQNDDLEDVEDKGFDIAHGFCPSCSNLIVLVRDGTYIVLRGEGKLDKISSEVIVYPKNINHQKLAPEVPDEFSNEFDEAASVLDASPKASAAISRRLLQKLLHEKFGIKARNLDKEIEEFISRKDLPSHISEAVDAVRSIGNFAAHPIKNTNTGEIVEVESGEAEWLLEVLESLLDFAFVQPEKFRKRKDELNKKLEAIGKRPMKEIVSEEKKKSK